MCFIVKAGILESQSERGWRGEVTDNAFTGGFGILQPKVSLILRAFSCDSGTMQESLRHLKCNHSSVVNGFQFI